MNIFFLVVGIIIMLLSLIDIMVTTFAPRGNGFIANRLRAVIWWFFLFICNRNGKKGFLNYCGMVTVGVTVIGWILAVWIGNTFIFMFDPNSVLETGTLYKATSVEKFYYVGYVLSTMGNGDFEPNGEFWRIYAAFISFAGFLIVSISVTYLVPVVSSEKDKRKTSIFIHSLGVTSDEMLLNSWNGKDFNRLTRHFNDLASQLLEQSQNHLAYPVLHNFHSHLQKEAIAINVVVLDEALTILLLYLPDTVEPDKEEIRSIRYAISNYIETLSSAFIKPSEKEPHPIDVSSLRKAGIPLKQHNSAIDRKIEKLRFRRKLLLGMLENDGWTWDDLFKEPAYNNLDIELRKQAMVKQRNLRNRPAFSRTDSGN